MTKSDREARDAILEKLLDADEVNNSFSAPFSGMKEMYALRKGLEHGAEIGWQSALEHSPRVTNAINALKEISYDAIRAYGSQEKAEASHPFCWKLVFEALAEFRKGSEE